MGVEEGRDIAVSMMILTKEQTSVLRQSEAFGKPDGRDTTSSSPHSTTVQHSCVR